MRRLVPLLLFAAGTAGAADITHSELLARIRTRMATNLSRLPNYTCRETIERAIRTHRMPRFETQGILRLEVAYLEGMEMFAGSSMGTATLSLAFTASSRPTLRTLT
jgi:hypothetical protein